MPKMTYEATTKSFVFTVDKRRKMNPDASARARMFRERYQLARQRVLRNELFVKPVMGHDRNYLKLVTVDSLLGTHGKRRRRRGVTCLHPPTYRSIHPPTDSFI